MNHDASTTIKLPKLPDGWRLQWRSDSHWAGDEQVRYRARLGLWSTHTCRLVACSPSKAGRSSSRT